MLITTNPPHIPPSKEALGFISERNLFKFLVKEKVFFALYTTDFDIQKETPFWYVIKDKGYCFEELSSNARRQIRRGRESFVVEKINPDEYRKEMYAVFCSSMQGYDKAERISVSFEDFKFWYKEKAFVFFGAFVRQSDNSKGELVGYKIYSDSGNGCIDQCVQKVKVEWEQKHVANVLEDALLLDVRKELEENQKYVCCGWRNLHHKTNNEKFLEEHFKFRKAYCRLHIRMCLLMNVAVFLLMPLYPLLSKSKKKILYDISSVLLMTKIARECKKT